MNIPAETDIFGDERSNLLHQFQVLTVQVKGGDGMILRQVQHYGTAHHPGA